MHDYARLRTYSTHFQNYTPRYVVSWHRSNISCDTCLRPYTECSQSVRRSLNCAAMKTTILHALDKKRHGRENGIGLKPYGYTVLLCGFAHRKKKRSKSHLIFRVGPPHAAALDTGDRRPRRPRTASFTTGFKYHAWMRMRITWGICTRRAGKLYKARSRRYRSQILRVNTHWN